MPHTNNELPDNTICASNVDRSRWGTGSCAKSLLPPRTPMKGPSALRGKVLMKSSPSADLALTDYAIPMDRPLVTLGM
ncbi:hypothetical protein ACE6H2_006627 [Prunus campanulata]